ncbi:MAG TPA: VWA domain-containing protein [Candidatus Acidoferrales bacterium]|nr:VWA domain-containing protein [Candidatus Acidoferrales bacterium]
MRGINPFRFFVLGLSAAAIILTASGQENAKDHPASSPAANQQAQPSQPEGKLKVNTRLVTVDVVVTDSHGEPVRDLQPADFQIFEDRNVREQIAHFEFSGNTFAGAGNTASLPAGVYSNMPGAHQFQRPPTILLVDGLNTTTTNQLHVRQNLLRAMKTLPSDTPVAVFLLGKSLIMLQNFTTDSSLLHTAVDRALSASTLTKNPQLDPSINAAVAEMQSVAALEPSVNFMIEGLEDFETEVYTQSVDDRKRETMQALRSIADYVSGYPGRKNLIWLTEAFPYYLVQQPGYGSNWRWGIGASSNDDETTLAGRAIADAQVAIYPVDAKGMATWDTFAADRIIPPYVPASHQTPEDNSLLPGTGAQTHIEEREWNASEDTMSVIAEGTGGRPCMHTNDLSGCVQSAMKDGAAYYELSFYPQGIRWDGAFHSIVVKVTRPHLHLDYRRGFYAVDSQTLLTQRSPSDRAKDACSAPLPSTDIYLTAKSQESADADKIKYLLTVSPGDLQIPISGGSHSLDILVASCLYNARGDAGEYMEQEDTASVSDADFRNWKAAGIPDVVTVKRDPAATELRIVVVDKHGGLTGALDLPLTSVPETQELPAAPAPAPTQPSASSAPPPQGDTQAGLKEFVAESSSLIPYFAKPYFLRFRSQQGQAVTMDWSKGAVTYSGDIPLNETSTFFFQSFFGPKFHCQSGNLVSNDSKSKASPILEFRFIDADGRFGVVDLRGAEPQYSGDLPFDASARAFFEAELALCQCRAK